MSESPASAPGPASRRLRRPGLRDPRLLIGVVVVASSVALGGWAVARAGETVPVYVVGAALVPGDRIHAEDLLVHQVRLADPAPYLAPGPEPLPDLIVLRTLGAGELVPRAALGVAAAQEWRPVAVTPAAALPAAVVPGSLVDLWSVPPEGDPQELAAALVVAEIAQPSGAFAVSQAPTLQVLVPRDLLPTVLTALAGPGSVEVVAVPGGVAGGVPGDASGDVPGGAAP